MTTLRELLAGLQRKNYSRPVTEAYSENGMSRVIVFSRLVLAVHTIKESLTRLAPHCVKNAFSLSADRTGHTGNALLNHMSPRPCQRISGTLSSRCLHRWVSAPADSIWKGRKVCHICSCGGDYLRSLESLGHSFSIWGRRRCSQNMECHRNDPCNDCTRGQTNIWSFMES